MKWPKQDSLKQQIEAKAQRLRRYTWRANFFRQNKTFRDNAKKLYRELRKKAIIIQKPPSLEEVELANAYNKFSRTKNSSQSGCPKEWLSWYQKPMTQKTLKATSLSVAQQLCTRSWPPSLQKGPTSSSKATVCSTKCKKDATVEVMASSSSKKPPWGDEIQMP